MITVGFLILLLLLLSLLSNVSAAIACGYEDVYENGELSISGGIYIFNVE